MKKRSVFFGVVTAAFCCAAVLFLVGIGQVLGFIPRGVAGYLDSSFYIVEGIACLVFGAQAASMVRQPRQTRSTWASIPVVDPGTAVPGTRSTLSRVTYAVCAAGIAFVGTMHVVLAWQLAAYVSVGGITVALLAVAALAALALVWRQDRR